MSFQIWTLARPGNQQRSLSFRMCKRGFNVYCKQTLTPPAKRGPGWAFGKPGTSLSHYWIQDMNFRCVRIPNLGWQAISVNKQTMVCNDGVWQPTNVLVRQYQMDSRSALSCWRPPSNRRENIFEWAVILTRERERDLLLRTDQAIRWKQ